SRVLPIHKQIVEEMFCSIGVISELAENLFSVFTAICGSAPAFTYLYIDALAKAAVAAGMPRAQALALAAHGVYGSAKMVMESELHPGELVDQVCSPGGTTIEGVLALERAGFASGIHQAVAAVIAKDKKLAEK
ncbi:MAG: pyrroline-5-carboxylate reductase dimerization domain-containing protein, partial [Clostridiales bacterium]